MSLRRSGLAARVQDHEKIKDSVAYMFMQGPAWLLACAQGASGHGAKVPRRRRANVALGRARADSAAAEQSRQPDSRGSLLREPGELSEDASAQSRAEHATASSQSSKPATALRRSKRP